LRFAINRTGKIGGACAWSSGLNSICKAPASGAEQRLQGEFATRVSQLTTPEKEVLELLIPGNGRMEIASVRYVTMHTACIHCLSILQKMGVQSDLRLVRVATQRKG
jgi:DNA-binding NarL/FixJ family response regulator